MQQCNKNRKVECGVERERYLVDVAVRVGGEEWGWSKGREYRAPAPDVTPRSRMSTTAMFVG